MFFHEVWRYTRARVCGWTRAVWLEKLNATVCTVERIANTSVQWSHVCMFRDSACLNNEELSAPRPSPKLEDHTWSAVLHCLFNIFAATLLIGGRSSTRNLRTRHAVVTGTHWKHVLTEQQVVSSVTKKKIYTLLRRFFTFKSHTISRYKCILGPLLRAYCHESHKCSTTLGAALFYRISPRSVKKYG